jgi:hypothetical protein
MDNWFESALSGAPWGEPHMHRETLHEWLKRRPFQPFRVFLADGRVLDIRYPRMNLLARTFIKIGIPEADATDPLICDHTEYVPLAHITRLEPLSAGQTQAS